MTFRDAERFFAVGSGDDLESVLGEKRAGELAKSVGVFDEQDGFGAAKIVGAEPRRPVLKRSLRRAEDKSENMEPIPGALSTQM